MTLVSPSLSDTARTALQARLDGLLTQRVEVFAESTSAGATGDAADRAGNVEAIIRLEEIDARISALREQLSVPSAAHIDGDTVQIGSRVRVRFGAEAEAESFLIGVLEESGGTVEVITPSSPLGRALLGARGGDQIAYRAATGTTLTATLVDVDS